MSNIITAHFDSIDMATLAAKSIATHITGIDAINVITKPKKGAHDDDRDLLLLATPYNSVDYSNGMMSATTQPYMANAAVLIDLTERQRHSTPPRQKIRVEVKTTNGDIHAINGTLRSFGGLSITERSGVR